MRLSKSFMGDAFTVLVLFLATGAFLSLFVDVSSIDNLNSGSALIETVWSGIYLGVLVRAFSLRFAILRILRENKLLVILMGLALLSTAWSSDPSLTARRSVILVLSTLFAVDMTARYPLRRQLSLIAIAVGSAVALSAIVELFFPGLVPQGPSLNGIVDTTWHGVFVEKNGLGHLAAFSVLCVLALAPRKQSGYVFGALGICGIIAIILAADSRTGLVTSLVLMMQWPVLAVLHWRKRNLASVGIAIVLISFVMVVMAYFSIDALTAAIGRQPDLTGRTPIWNLCLESIAKRPVLGYGWDGFWGKSGDSARINSILGWNVPYAHNVYIDVALQLGLVGLVIFLAIFLQGIVQAVRYTRLLRTTESIWPIAYFLFCIYYGFSESGLPGKNDIFWMVFVTAASTVNCSAQEAVLSSSETNLSPSYVDERSLLSLTS